MNKIESNSILFDTDIDDISKDTLQELYQVILKIRKVELRIEDLYSEDEMRTPVHLYIGQEAIADIR